MYYPLGVVGKGPDVRLSRWRPLLIAPAATQVVELCPSTGCGAA